MEGIEEIKERFKEVISHSQGIDNPKVDGLFEQWKEAKAQIIEAMGGLIYEYPEKVAFELGAKERKSRVNDFITLLENRWENYELAEFVATMRDAFFSNIMPHDFTTHKGEIIKKGSKIVKAFKFFEEDKCALTDIQNHASRIIQEDKIEGKLCLSVHPLDYLSVSENTYNWRSCHALDGDYRSGNLSYMVDRSTIVCYLKSDKEEMLPNFPFPWNSKKWRVLIYLSNDWRMVMAGRQYPFATDVGLNFILSNLLTKSGISKNCCWTPWHTELISSIPFEGREGRFSLNHKYVPVGGSLISLGVLVKDMPGSMQFNDLLKSSCYEPMYAYRQRGDEYNQFFYWEHGETHSKQTRFEIGGTVPCLRCGERDLGVSESMQCLHCEEEFGSLENDNFGYCSCCGRHIFLDNGHWIDDDNVVCDGCYENETGRCEHCGDMVFKNELTFNRHYEEYICRNCQEDFEWMERGV